MIFLKQKSPKHPTLSWLPSYKIGPPICKIIHPTMLTVCNSAQWDSMVCVRTGKQWEGENQSIHRGVSYRAWACESKTRSGPVGAFCSQFSLHSSFKRPHMKAMWKISQSRHWVSAWKPAHWLRIFHPLSLLTAIIYVTWKMKIWDNLTCELLCLHTARKAFEWPVDS